MPIYLIILHGEIKMKNSKPGQCLKFALSSNEDNRLNLKKSSDKEGF